MRIGLVTGEYPPDQGGVGDFSRELGRALAELGHRVHVITDRSQAPTLKGGLQPLCSEAQTSGMMVHRVLSGWGWGCWREVLQMAREERLEVLNVQYQASAYGMHPAINFVPRRQGRPGQRMRPVVAVTCHDLKVPYLFPKAGPLRWRVVRMLVRRADSVIVTNQEDYLRLEGEVPTDRLSLIPISSNIPATPPPEYDRVAERAKYGVGPDSLLLGYFGFLNESKGGEELVQALATLVARGIPAHLLMIGGRVGSSDPTNRAYAKRVENLIIGLGLGERVHWTGYTRPEEVSAALLAVDACVLPYRDGVSFRRGTLHACLAHGRAVITTRPAVELPQVRDGENMLLVEPRDQEGLAEAVTRLVADPALQVRLATGATALAAEFTWERIARRTAMLFAVLMKGSVGRPSPGWGD